MLLRQHATRQPWTRLQRAMAAQFDHDLGRDYEACPICGESWEFGVFWREDVQDTEPGTVVW